jgi:hypothetical protein
MLRVICVIVLGLMLTACDRCGDIWPPKFQMQVCKETPPQPQ